MQLKNIKGQMTLAACALLQITSPSVQAQDAEWDIETAVLLYNEGNGRVSAFEPAIYAGRNINDTDRLDVRLVVDALTGASPNGAHASTVAQTFTTPSGQGSYTSKAGETPLDNTFHDTRVAMGLDWTMELDRLSKLTLGGNLSKEFDYTSFGLSASFARDFNNRNTTLTTAVAFNNDTINPVGNIPTELKPMVRAGLTSNREGSSDSKTITDFLIGVTQVVSRKTLVQFNYSLGLTDGYQNDPFKIVTVVGTDGNLANSGFFDTNTTGNLPYVYEKRPNSRQRNSLYFKTVHHLDEDVINFSYRYYWDDWDITSHTFDFRYRYEMGGSYLQPHVRYYMQSAAKFHTHNLVLGSDVNATTGVVNTKFASNDYRLAESETLTLGVKYGIPRGDNSEFSVRAEIISQTVTDDNTVASNEKTPGLDAIIMQVNYTLRW